MRALSFAWWSAIAVLALAIPVGAFLGPQADRPAPATQSAQHILIHMKEYIAEVHETYMGLELADRLQRGGAKVTVWLELRAVRLANDRIRANPRPGGRSFSDIWKSFVEHGGRVLVCHHCAQFEEVSNEHLRTGATFVGVDDVAQAILEADKIVDY